MGDVVTPYPLNYTYNSVITNLSFNLFAYSSETILSEKFETLISKGLNNSRTKDLIDIYLLVKKGYDIKIFNSEVINTFYFRKTNLDKEYIFNVIKEIEESIFIKTLFQNYSEKTSFAKDISFDDCINSIYRLANSINFYEKIKIKGDITLVRPGQDEREKLGGWSDNHLIDEGVLEVKELLNDLNDNYDIILSSDLNRAKETTEIINNKINCDVEYLEDLRETNNGDLKNLTKIEAKENYLGLYYNSLKMDESYPNGESPINFFDRVKTVFEDINDKYVKKNIMIVTHGGVITVIPCLINGWEYSNLLKIAPKTGTKIELKMLD